MSVREKGVLILYVIVPRRISLQVILLAACCLTGTLLLSHAAAQQANPHEPPGGKEADVTDSDPQAAAAMEAALLSGTRQLTFEGRRAGEGYFSKDSSQLVFQSEREPGNPFFQIYVMNMKTGVTQRMSPGRGKTTCAWIHPNGNKVLFASTQDDENAADKQRAEIKQRESGKQSRYTWDFDDHFEIYEYDRKTHDYRNLTHTRGYDAEGSWSPDGRLIAFTSNRRAYQSGLNASEKKAFDADPASMNDIYIMDADGNNVRQLTSELGYDGGPFFSPDGTRICWRRFSPDGARAEVWTMNIDGSDKRQLTRMGAMSWAPFYHPSGRYLIFTTNRHGFANFELYLIDVDGKSMPARVTYSKGFDGLPAFTPDGKRLAWTSNRAASGQSQLFLANWNHERACELLGLRPEAAVSRPSRAGGNPATASSARHSREGGNPATAAKERSDSDQVAISEIDAQSASDANTFAERAHKLSDPNFKAEDIRRHVEYLCRNELEGRFTGSRGERLATAYVAAYMEKLGLKPAGDDGGWFQKFEFTSGVALGPGNDLVANGKSYEVDKDWRPLSFSGTGQFKAAPLVFAGYGIVAPADKTHEEYDSYAHLDVKDKWVVVFRYLPEKVSPEMRQHLNRESQLRFKTTFARERGARGFIVVTGPNAQARSELIPLQLDGMLAGSGIPMISVTNEVADSWLSRHGKSLKQLQDELDDGSPKLGFQIEGVQLAAKINVQSIRKTGRNVLGKLPAAGTPSNETIVIGAHVDHLGKGTSSSSLARADEVNKIHYGADDNASGVAALLEIAENLADQSKRGSLNLRRDLMFAAWSGEELGLLGSDHFVKALGHTRLAKNGDGASLQQISGASSIYPSIAAYLNMDMVGRLRKNLILQGIGSSEIWRTEIERCNVPVGLPITLQEDSYLPTDATSFYLQGVPILAAFTGAHSEYHTPRDTPEKLNYDGAAKVARFMGLLATDLAGKESPPNYVQQTVKQPTTGGRLRVYLGTIPDYAEEVKGVLLSGASKGGPADKAGVRARDIIVELAGKKIENIYDYTQAIEALRIGERVKMTVVRNGERMQLEITPGSRD